MPMIDVYATSGTFSDRKTLARDLAAAVMRWEGVPAIPLFQDNTAAFIHELPDGSISDAGRRTHEGQAAWSRQGADGDRRCRRRCSRAGRAHVGADRRIAGWWLGYRRPREHGRRHCRPRAKSPEWRLRLGPRRPRVGRPGYCWVGPTRRPWRRVPSGAKCNP
jgi:hypothetical protein